MQLPELPKGSELSQESLPPLSPDEILPDFSGTVYEPDPPASPFKTGRCPHRGGPFALGTLDPSGRSIVCPWNDTKIGLRGLFRKAVPTVWRRAGAATAVFPEADGVVAANTRTGFLAESIGYGCPLAKHEKPAPSEWDGGERHGD